MAERQVTRIPRVPVRTPMFDEHGNLTRTWIIFFEQLGGRFGWSDYGDGELKATFGIVSPLRVVDDLTNHFISRSAGTFVSLVANAKRPPMGTAARIEIEKSTDEGQTWNTIFASPGYIELPVGDDTRLDWDSTVFRTDGDAGKIAVGDFLRINCTQMGSAEPGAEIEFVLRWE